ncbi:MAG: hypothetical protein HY059_10105 [Proteobacteria bacterium]|nr:hypothetical protein [Pseudomonadota bacterium]
MKALFAAILVLASTPADAGLLERVRARGSADIPATLAAPLPSIVARYRVDSGYWGSEQGGVTFETTIDSTGKVVTTAYPVGHGQTPYTVGSPRQLPPQQMASLAKLAESVGERTPKPAGGPEIADLPEPSLYLSTRGGEKLLYHQDGNGQRHQIDDFDELGAGALLKNLETLQNEAIKQGP